MFPNLEAEMAKRNITRKKLSEILSVTQTTLGLKLNGKAKLTLPECLEIKNAVAPDKSIEFLFEDNKPEYQ